MSHEVKAAWKVVDVDTLPANLRSAYQDYKTAYAYMKEARETFEKSMQAAATLPTHERLVFGYNFGKLSVAIVPAEPAKPKTDRNAMSLAEFLAAKRAEGART